MSSFNPPLLSFGAQLIGATRTRFRLWAPDLQRVHVEFDGMAPLAMQALADGWFQAEADCAAGTRYRYRVSAELAVPDPAAHAQASDIHGYSLVCDPQQYRWRNDNWRGRPWHESVLYEMHPGICGGFDGIRQRLPALAELGVTAIELMPIADFPGRRNWGYDGVLPYAPASAYGTPEQLKAMIDSAHGLGLMVFLDVVYNHFGPDGNYLGAYASDFFRDDIHTPWGQAIDFRRQQVRDFFTENALYWLEEFRCDGLRFDAVHAISEKDWLLEMATRVRAQIDPQRHVHLVLENDDNLASLLEPQPALHFDAQWNDDGHHALHVLLTGESEGYYAGYTEQPSAKLARGLAEGFIYQGDAALHPGGPLRGEPSAHLAPTAFVLFLQNHDQVGNRAFGERLTTLADPAALQAAYALLLLAPQIPLLFMGEEYGATQPFLYFTDHQTQALADAVRDGRRQEFSRFSAFADPARRALIPDPNAEQTFLDSMPQPDADTGENWRNSFKGLLAIRRHQIMPRLPGARALGASAIGAAAVSARWRMGDGSVLLLALNLGETTVSLAPEAATVLHAGTLLYSTQKSSDALRQDQVPPRAFIAVLQSVQQGAQ